MVQDFSLVTTFLLLKIGYGTKARTSWTGNPVAFSTSQGMS